MIVKRTVAVYSTPVMQLVCFVEDHVGLELDVDWSAVAPLVIKGIEAHDIFFCLTLIQCILQRENGWSHTLAIVRLNVLLLIGWNS